MKDSSTCCLMGVSGFHGAQTSLARCCLIDFFFFFSSAFNSVSLIDFHVTFLKAASRIPVILLARALTDVLKVARIILFFSFTIPRQ